jgi:deoxyribonuclease I
MPIRKFVLLASLQLLALLAFADDSRYEHVRDTVFWPLLYNVSYETLYCGVSKQAGEKVTVEHAYPASWIAVANGCVSRDDCPKDAYRAASSDLHNLWPALRRYNTSRGNQPFGEIPGEKPRFKNDTCDYERTSGAGAVVEPRDQVKGDIARSILYMIHYYDLPDHDMLPMLVRWHIQDPPGAEERRRNDKIEELQGNRNPFID